jgi:hypothetical protein
MSDKFTDADGPAAAAPEAIPFADVPLQALAFFVSVRKYLHLAARFAQCLDSRTGGEGMQAPHTVLVGGPLRHATMVEAEMVQIARSFMWAHLDKETVGLARRNSLAGRGAPDARSSNHVASSCCHQIVRASGREVKR